VQRAFESGLVLRRADPADRRVVRIRLSPRGARALERLSSAHLEELARLAGPLRTLWDGLDVDQRHGRPRHEGGSGP